MHSETVAFVSFLYFALIDVLMAIVTVFGVSLGLYVLLRYVVRKACNN